VNFLSPTPEVNSPQQAYTPLPVKKGRVCRCSILFNSNNVNPLKPSDSYILSALRVRICIFLKQSIYEFRVILTKTVNISLNTMSEVDWVMEKCCVFFEIRTELLNII
jgi:hypothetical protein